MNFSHLPVPPSPAIQRFCARMEGLISATTARIEKLIREALFSIPPADPGELCDAELLLHQRIARELDQVTAVIIQTACGDPDLLAHAEQLARNAGLRPQRSSVVVRINTLGGSTVDVQTCYFLRRRERSAGHRRSGRGKAGNGVYPVLDVLGIHSRTTPALMSEIGRLVAQGTLQEAQANLDARGIRIGIKEVHRLARHLAQRALAYREWCTETAGWKLATDDPDALARGKRIAIAIDGGRLRTRVPRGRRRKNGAMGFHADWKEPKVFVVYEIDDSGRKKRLGFARYGGTMGDADCAFELLAGLLLELGAKDATEWVFLGDGGVWIWKRLALLVDLVGFDPARVTQVLDFYHAVEHVNEIQELFPAWSKAERGCWRDNVKSFLRRGDVRGLVSWTRSSLCQGPEATKVEAQLVYLLDNETRMDYGLYKRRRLPLGSGAIESGIRRVINLRMKGNGIFWTPANAEGVIHMRAELLSGRWNAFIRAVLQPVAKWAA